MVTGGGQDFDVGLVAGPEKYWISEIRLIQKDLLKASGNTLYIEARNSAGNSGGNLDDFLIDNLVVFYKTK